MAQPDGRGIQKGVADKRYSLLPAWQSYTASGTITAPTSLPLQEVLVRLSGSTASQTITMPAAPLTGQRITIFNQSSQSWTISGNGKNISGSATRNLSNPVSANLIYDGTQWVDVAASFISGGTFTGAIAINANSSLGSTLSATASGGFSVGGKLNLSSQSFSTSGQTIATTPPFVSWTATAVATPTISLPSANLTTGQILIIKDSGGNCATNNLTISGNGANIDGSASYVISSNYGRVTLRWNGTKWDVIG